MNDLLFTYCEETIIEALMALANLGLFVLLPHLSNVIVLDPVHSYEVRLFIRKYCPHAHLFQAMRTPNAVLLDFIN